MLGDFQFIGKFLGDHWSRYREGRCMITFARGVAIAKVLRREGRCNR